MRDGLWGNNGERLQAWLQRSMDIRGRSWQKGLPGHELGLVIARYYKDDAENTSGIFTEYDIFLTRQQLTLFRLPMVVPYQGVSGGNQITLKPAEGIPDITGPTAWKNLMDSDGDLVLIAYVGEKQPVIIGCMNHLRDSDESSADWVTDSTDGEVYSLSYNTTRARINNDGDVELDLASTDRSVTVNMDGTQVMKIYNSGGDLRIELGQGTLEKVILGESFADWINSSNPANIGLVNHVHQYIDVDNTGTPLSKITGTPVSATLVAAPPMDENTLLTEKVKVEV